MSNAQLMVGAAIAVFAIGYYKFLLRPLLSKPLVADDIDASVARFKRRRNENGLCAYCGQALQEALGHTDEVGESRGAIRICAACVNDMNPSV